MSRTRTLGRSLVALSALLLSPLAAQSPPGDDAAPGNTAPRRQATLP